MFYRGKHVAKSARSSKLNKTTLMVVSLVLLFTFVIGGTVAWIMDATDPVVNTFDPVNVSTNIEETLEANKKTDVDVRNTGETPIYVRAK